MTLRFVPQKRDCSEGYCPNDSEITGESEDSLDAPRLMLYANSTSGMSQKRWDIFLEDWGGGPMGMALADSGHVLIADRWCDAGLGEKVIVLYGPDGEELQSWSLAEILPSVYVAALHQTSFNVHWRGAVSYDSEAKTFNFQIALPSEEFFGKIEFVDLMLDPVSRMFVPRDQGAWTEALKIARSRVVGLCAERKWRLERAAAYLSAPINDDRRTWLNFAMEIERRIRFPEVQGSWDQRLFLSSPDSQNYEADLKEFKRRLTMTREERITQNFYLLSPNLENAHLVLKAFLSGEKGKNLGNDRFVIVGDDPIASSIVRTIADYGGSHWEIVGTRDAIPPKSDREDYDWRGKRACAAIQTTGITELR